MKFWSLLGLLMLLPAVAGADVSFEAGVNVATEAENASLAKEEAMKKANREAFLKVASRLTTKANVDKLNELTDDQLLHFIREVSVVAERSGSKTYQADLNIKINENLLKQYMQENEMLEVVSSPSKVLVVPVFSDTVYPDKVIWEDGNVWRQAWLDKGLIKSGAYDFIVIADNAVNRQLLSAEKAETISLETYDKLVSNNGIKDIFGVNAVRAGRNTLVVVIRAMPSGVEKRIMVTAEDGEPFDKAVAETVGYISSVMQGRTVEESSRQGSIDAVFYFNRLPEWLNMEKRLNNIPQIKRVRADAIGGRSVKISLEFSGSENRLRSSLENSGIYLQLENGYYILR